MAKHKILIVEDDNTLAHALAAVAEKAGYDADIFSDPHEALAAIDKNYYKLVFIDLLLPQMPGIDLAKQIRQTFDPSILPIIMMSGVFVDKQMAKETAKEIGALAFLIKPFEATDITRYLKREGSKTVEDDQLVASVFSLPDRVALDPNGAFKHFKALKKVSGFHLPILFGVMSRNQLTGVLQLISDSGSQIKLEFARGRLIHVIGGDRDSYLGEILLSGGWISSDDLSQAIATQNVVRIGERLLESNFVSPHAIEIAMGQQMAIRIGQMVCNQNFIVGFEFRSEGEIEGLGISRPLFYRNLSEAIIARVSHEWLFAELSRFQGNRIKLTNGIKLESMEFAVPVLQSLGDWPTGFADVVDFSALQKRYETDINAFHQAFYYLLCIHGVSFAERILQVSEEERTVRLQRIWAQFEKASHLEVFHAIGGQEGLSPEEIDNLFEQYVRKYIGNAPDNDFNEALKTSYHAVKTKITETINLVKDSKKWQQYCLDLDRDKVSKKTHAQSKIDDAKKYLAMRQYSNAMVALDGAFQLEPHSPAASLFLVWARIGMLSHSKNKKKDIQDIAQIMARVPYEMQLTSEGNFIQGLLAKVKGETASARQFFKAALALDKNLLEARRELNVLPPEVEQVNIFQADLGKLIGNLFKK